MKNVSFGAVYTIKEPNMYMSKKQYAIDSIIDKTFDTAPYPYDMDYEALSEFIEDKTLCDVLVKHKKDGNVEVKLYSNVRKQLYDNYDVEKDEDNKPIKILLDLNKSFPSLCKQIKKFADRCLNYAETGFEAGREKELDEALNTDQDEFMKKQAALDAIREEARFDKEFGVGTEERWY